jgi:predicted N-acetyltransferase YhbS
MRIEYLADRVELIPELARLHFAEWGYLRPSETLEGRTERLRRCVGRQSIPTVLIALSDDELCGSAMLVEHDMDSRPSLTPWLAGMVVAPTLRRRGIGSALVKRIVSEAQSLGVTSLYLYTPLAEDFYAHHGWSALEHCEYLGARVAVMSRQLSSTQGE